VIGIVLGLESLEIRSLIRVRSCESLISLILRPAGENEMLLGMVIGILSLCLIALLKIVWVFCNFEGLRKEI